MNDSLFLLVSLEYDPVHRSKQDNRIGNFDKLGRCSFVKQQVISIGISLSCPPLLLWVEDVGGSMRVGSDGGGVLGRVGVGRVEGDGGGEGGDVLEDVLGLQEFRIDMFGSEETLTNYEDLCRDVTEMSVADSSNESTGDLP